MNLQYLKSYFIIKHRAAWYSFILTGLSLSLIHIFGPTNPVLLIFDRILPGAGWLEIAMLTLYALVVTDNIIDPSKTILWRKRIWLFFSIVFFTQLLLGLIGYKIFLMTGKLHFQFQHSYLPVLCIEVKAFLCRYYFLQRLH